MYANISNVNEMVNGVRLLAPEIRFSNAKFGINTDYL